MSTLGIENLSGAAKLDIGHGVSERQSLRDNVGLGGATPDLGTSGDTPTFAKILSSSFEQVNTMQVQSDHAIKEMVAGRSKNIHETMLTIERADTSLKMMMQVRNKILDAYREIMRMQV